MVGYFVNIVFKKINIIQDKNRFTITYIKYHKVDENKYCLLMFLFEIITFQISPWDSVHGDITWRRGRHMIDS